MKSIEKSENVSKYKGAVDSIKNLNWESLNEQDLENLMVLSAYAADEFAESLKIALRLYPDNELLQEMAEGELDTENLSFGDYDRSGNHADFLWYFLKKYGVIDRTTSEVTDSGVTYQESIRQLPDEVRATSVFSREEELPDIFEKILGADHWDSELLQAYRYYLERHIALDSEEGGHADLVADMEIDDRVKEFYEKRLEMYKAIATLFSKD